MLIWKILTPLAALILAFLGAGCLETGNKNALQNDRPAKDSADDREMAGADRNGRPDTFVDEEMYTPETSMRRDLDILKTKENRQARLIAEMRSELSENQNQITREEKRLAEMRNQINRYEEALGGQTAIAKRPARNAAGEYDYGEVLGDQTTIAKRTARSAAGEYDSTFDRALPPEYEAIFNRPAPANLAQIRTPEPGERQYVIKTNIPYEEFQAMQGPAQAATETSRPMWRDAGQFAGSPQGFPRQDVIVQSQPEPDIATLIWDPNDPRQPELPGVAAVAKTHPSAPARNQPEPFREGAAGMNSARQVAYQDNPQAAYATEAFSPDMYFGKGG